MHCFSSSSMRWRLLERPGWEGLCLTPAEAIACEVSELMGPTVVGGSETSTRARLQQPGLQLGSPLVMEAEAEEGPF